MAWRILCAVAMALAIFTAPAYAKPVSKQASSRMQCHADEDRGGRMVCTAGGGAPMIARAPVRIPKPGKASPAPRAVTVFAAAHDLVAEARRYIGTNPTNRRSLWCGAFMDLVLRRAGYQGGGNIAMGYAGYGRRIAGPQVGAIVVLTRKGGGHVGVVSGITPAGDPIVVSGNHNNTVAESAYPRQRVVAYVLPSA